MSLNKPQWRKNSYFFMLANQYANLFLRLVHSQSIGFGLALGICLIILSVWALGQLSLLFDLEEQHREQENKRDQQEKEHKSRMIYFWWTIWRPFLPRGVVLPIVATCHLEAIIPQGSIISDTCQPQCSAEDHMAKKVFFGVSNVIFGE